MESLQKIVAVHRSCFALIKLEWYENYLHSPLWNKYWFIFSLFLALFYVALISWKVVDFHFFFGRLLQLLLLAWVLTSRMLEL